MKRNTPPYACIRWWNRHQFKILVIGMSITVLILWVYRDDTEPGTYATSYFYEPPTSQRTPSTFTRHSRGETECRRVMESIFKRPFPSRRPLFLHNTVTGKPLEIDCCNEELRLGVEYNGQQHYRYVPGMHKSHDAFRTQQYRDEMKTRLCKDHGFTLIVVPYTVAVNEIEFYLRRTLRTLNYDV